MKTIVSWSARWINREKAKEATAELPGIGGVVAMGFRTEADAREWHPQYPGYEFVGVETYATDIDDGALLQEISRSLERRTAWTCLTLCPEDSPWIDFYRELARRAGGKFERGSSNGDDYVVVRPEAGTAC